MPPFEGQFAHEGSEPVTVDGFCDSTDGSVFRIRFMPSRPGRHDYSITYRQQGLERTQTGSFNAVASGRKGMLRVDPENRRHFIWEGTGEHYFWNGTTTYYLMGWDDETIRQQHRPAAPATRSTACVSCCTAATSRVPGASRLCRRRTSSCT